MADGLARPPLSADYYPKRQDSYVELARPETSFLEFFKQSLVYTSAYCTDRRCCSFFGDDAIFEGPATPTHDTSGSALKYPLLLFADLQDLPPRTVLHSLTQCFQQNVVSSLPFLSRVSSVVADQGKSHFHLRLCKVLLGAATSRDPQHRELTDRLWHACTSLVTGTVEVDNSLGRVTDWLSAATLLIAVGVMQSNVDWWQQTNCISGYVQATLFRRDYPMKSSASVNTTSVETEATALRCFYFMVDTLRSIHLHAPSTVEPTWSINLGNDAQYDLKDLSESLILDGRALPSDLAANDYLLVLLEILSNINTLLCSLGPFTSACCVVRREAAREYNKQAISPSLASATDMVTSSAAYPSANPHVPLTVDRELKQLSSNIGQSLDTWQSSFESSGLLHEAEAQSDSGTMLPLLHFAKLLLAAGPCVYTLPALAGYTSEPHESPPLPRPRAPHSIGIHFSDSVVRHAVDILEAIETQRTVSGAFRRSSDGQQPLSPMWYPLALFYGALVIWAQMKDGVGRTYSSHMLLPSRRLLQSFYVELQIIEKGWDCAKHMAEVVRMLMD